MEDEEIKRKLFQILKNVAPDTEPEKLKPDDKIRQVLGIDSFDYLQFIIGFDEHFGVQTPEEDYGNIETLRLLVPYISTRLKAKEVKM